MRSTFGLIDLAVAEQLRSRVIRLTSPNGVFLLDRAKFPDLVNIGPWLVDLSLCPAVESYWIKFGQWKDWGYVIKTELTITALQRHLKKFNLIQIEGRHNPMFFRYFDPVVIAIFLSEIATEEQKKAFLGPIEMLEIADSANKKVIQISG